MTDIRCDNCGKMVDKTECNFINSKGTVKALCFDCQDNKPCGEFVADCMDAISDLESEIRKLSKPIMACNPYNKYSVSLGEHRWFLQYAIMQNNIIETDIFSGDTKQEVEEKLSELRKAVYGVA